MKHAPLVSVIIPAYNVADSLTPCLDSVFQQDYRPLQVIVVDDGSTDVTLRIARAYGRGIHVISQKNRGQGAARNAGLKMACGEFIAFLDADDHWKPDFVKACVDFLSSHSEVIAVSTSIIVKMHDGSEVCHPVCFCGSTASGGRAFVIDNFFDFWARFDHVRTGSNVIRHSVIREAGLQRADLRISQDLEYWGYLATFGKWGFIPEPLWVGNSRQVARTGGWFERYATRRRLCPDVEQWGTRIEPRLQPWERKPYEIVRGRVAMSFAQSKIIAGNYGAAYHIVKKYGSGMPACSMRRVMMAGTTFGWPGWMAACSVVRLREWLKALQIRFS